MFHIPAHKQVVNPPAQLAIPVKAPAQTLADCLREEAEQFERLAAQRWIASRRAGRLNHNQGA